MKIRKIKFSKHHLQQFNSDEMINNKYLAIEELPFVTFKKMDIRETICSELIKLSANNISRILHKETKQVDFL